MASSTGTKLRRGLPLALSSFVGRAGEIAQVAHLTLTHRLVTLTGSGGAGKTRLAFEVSRRLAAEFVDGVCVVELASLADPDFVAGEVAQALGLLEPADKQLLERLAAYLEERNLLLILDNCEHLVEGCAALVGALLRGCCRDLHILATSREPLGVPGEIAWRVPPLPVPPLGATQDDTSELAAYDGVRLFVGRAQDAATGFVLTPQNARAVAAICRRLDGMPLAIELAAARVKVLTPEQIEDRLEDALSLLGGGGRLAPHRHRTMRATIDWSYGLLDSLAAAVLRRLSVFSGGCTLEGATAVCADVTAGSDQTLEIMAQLVDKSLVVARPEGSEMRYDLLEVIRQFAAGELRGQGEEDATRERHLEYYLALAERAKPQLRTAGMRGWLGRLDLEHDNIRSALDFALKYGADSVKQYETAVRMAGAMEPFWRIRNHWTEGRALLARVLAVTTTSGNLAHRAQALMDAANLAWFQAGSAAAEPLIGESIDIWRELQPAKAWELANALRILGMTYWKLGGNRPARPLLQESLDLFRRVGDELGSADALWNLGASAAQDDPALSREYNEQALAIYERHGDLYGAGRPRFQLASWYAHRGDYALAQRLYEQCLADSQALENKYGIAASLLALGRIARLTGDLERAKTDHAEAIRLCQDIGAPLGDELQGMGYVLLAQGDHGEASALFRHALDAFRESGDEAGIAGCLIGFAHLKCALGGPREAAQLLGAAQALSERIGKPLVTHDLADWERCLEIVRSALDAPTFAAAWADGHILPLEAAITLGSRPPGGTSASSSTSLTPLRAAKAQYGGLTAREREIAAHVASGKSNREIADELVVSERTVEAHVGNILSKLEFTSRTQIATWAMEKGLLRTAGREI